MAHYALLNSSNIVVQVINGRDEDETVDDIFDWEAHYSEVTGLRALRTSFNTYGGIHYKQDKDGNRVPSENQSKAFRKNYAGVGYTYDENSDAFIPPKPFDSWTLNNETFQWDPPEDWPKPKD